jgi:hypothetical protein
MSNGRENFKRDIPTEEENFSKNFSIIYLLFFFHSTMQMQIEGRNTYYANASLAIHKTISRGDGGQRESEKRYK